MRTFEEQLIFDVTGVKTEMFTNYSNFATDKIELTKIIRLAYNQAIEDAAENCTTELTPTCIRIDKQSILKLKKDASSAD